MQIEPVFFTSPFRILVIAAHPDDIEFGAAGSIARWTDAGAEVIYCIVTNGGAGSNKPDTDLHGLIALRQEEQNAAAALVGVQTIHYLGYQDGVLEPTLGLRRDLTRLIRQIKPHRVLIMDPTTVLIQGEGFDYINHPDHRATGEASLYAVFPSAGTRPIFPELLGEGLEPHEVRELYFMISTKPNLVVDITGTFDRKIESLLKHKSQIDDSVVEMIRMWDTEAGKELGIPMAETFRVMRFGEPGQPPTNGAEPTSAAVETAVSQNGIEDATYIPDEPVTADAR